METGNEALHSVSTISLDIASTKVVENERHGQHGRSTCNIM